MPLVDTDVLIDVLRGHEPARAWLASLPAMPDVPGFVAMELYQGCHSKREADDVTHVLRPFLRIMSTGLIIFLCLQAFSLWFVFHYKRAQDAAACMV